MFGKTMGDLRQVATDVREDADRHISRLTESLDRSSEILAVTLFAVGIIAGIALLVAVVGVSGD